MAKYDPLKEHLATSGQNIVTLGFDHISSLVGGLPATAFAKDEWWANEDIRTTRHTQCKSWQGAGYTVAADRKARLATFKRK